MTSRINFKLFSHLNKILNEKKNFPIGILANFGPDNLTITKTVAVIAMDSHAALSVKSWISKESIINSQVAAEIGKFFLDNSVTEVIILEGIVGCPHEEGTDFPLGERCPYCKYWTDRAG